MTNKPAGISRRQLFGGVGLTAAGVGLGAIGTLTGQEALNRSGTSSQRAFWGAGLDAVTRPLQTSGIVVTFDVLATQKSLLLSTLRRWSDAAGKMADGKAVADLHEAENSPEAPPEDSGEGAGMDAANLGFAIGYGASLFDVRFGLDAVKPAGLPNAQRFGRDQLVESQTGGDILLLITSDDEQVTFHAARNLIRIAKGAFRVRHMQAGFLPPEGQAAGTARNLFGFKDGTANYSPKDSALAEEHLLVKPADEPNALWLAGGTFAAFRQFKMAIETWDRSSLAEQEQIFGRSKLTGAPLHVSNPKDSDEFEPMNLNNAAIDKNSHVALAHPDSNGGVRILRRAFNYANGLDEVGHLDAGLLFFSFQRSIEKQFAPMQTKLASNDLMNEYVVATGSAYFAVPRGPEQGSHWGAEFA